MSQFSFWTHLESQINSHFLGRCWAPSSKWQQLSESWKKDKTSQHNSIRAPNLLKTNVSGESSASSVSSVNSVNSVNSVSSVSSVGRVLKQATFITYFPEDNCLCSSSPDFATKMILMLLFSRQIKMSSPNLNNVIIIGCILCYSRWSKIVQSLPQKSIHRLLQNIRKYNPPKYFQRNHSRSRLLYHINQRFSVHLHSQGKQVKWWQWCTGCPKKTDEQKIIPHNDIKCVLGINESKFNGKRS